RWRCGGLGLAGAAGGNRDQRGGGGDAMHAQRWGMAGVVFLAAPGTRGAAATASAPAHGPRPRVTALVADSHAGVGRHRTALLTNQTGVDEHGVSDIEVLRDSRARAAGVRLVRLFSPEHGIRGTEDRTHIESGVDERSGLPVHSLYTETAIAPPDSLLTDLDA